MKVILLTCDFHQGGHAHIFTKAWKDFFLKNKVVFEAKTLKSASSLRSSKFLDRIRIFVVDLFGAIIFGIKLKFQDRNAFQYLFLDPPCSFPLGIRIVFYWLLKTDIGKRSSMICHAYPKGGDTRPEGFNSKVFEKYFGRAQIFAHSANLRKYLLDDIGISANQIKEFSWGCAPTRKSSFQPEKPLRILFCGQYRSSKGLEWFWKELQEFKIPSEFLVVLSAHASVAENVKLELLQLSSKNSNHSLDFQHALYFKDEEIDSFFNQIDILIIPYFADHSLVSGLVYLAAEHGCPVISSTHSESGNLPHSHGFGYFFNPRDGQEMRNQLQKYIALNQNEKLKMREAALKFAEGHSWNEMLKRIWKEIQETRYLN
jgi:glycosyltransferase involved in cell wall biosynthesis